MLVPPAPSSCFNICVRPAELDPTAARPGAGPPPDPPPDPPPGPRAARTHTLTRTHSSARGRAGPRRPDARTHRPARGTRP